MHPLKGTDHNYADVLSMTRVSANTSACHELQFSPVIGLLRRQRDRDGSGLEQQKSVGKAIR